MQQFYDDLVVATDRGQVSGLYSLPTGFYGTVDHELLLHRLVRSPQSSHVLSPT